MCTALLLRGACVHHMHSHSFCYTFDCNTLAGNTVTCLALIVPPMVGIFRCQVDRLEARYTLSYLATLGVGLGSVLFHGTLLFEMEVGC